MKSTFLSLSARDFLKGLIMATIVPVLTIIQQSVTAGDLVFNYKSILIAAISGFVGYLLKQLFTDTTAAAVKTLEKQNVEVKELQPKL